MFVSAMREYFTKRVLPLGIYFFERGEEMPEQLKEIAFMACHNLAVNAEISSMQEELLNKHCLRKHGENAYHGQK